MNQTGFTVIEVVILLVLANIIFGIGWLWINNGSHYDWATGTTTKCVNGYVYVQAKREGALTQQIGADGKPDRCK